MLLNDLTPTNMQRITEGNARLRDFGVTVRPWQPKARLTETLDKIEENIIRIRNSSKQFQLDPEYAKFLNLKDTIDLMLAEGLYAESPAYLDMKEMVESSVRELMDSGYSMEEACAECMNRFRRDDRFAHGDDVILPIVEKAAMDYVEACNMSKESAFETVEEEAEEGIRPEVKESIAQEIGVELDLVEQKVETMAKVSKKSPESVIAFLNNLAEGDLVKGIRMFGKMIAEQNKFKATREQALAENKVEFTFNGKTYPIEENKIVSAGQLQEAVDIEQAEVVMAVRAIIDDLQDQVEKTGRTINEDVPAIATQMKTEMGADTAARFKATAEGALQAHMESAKVTKEALEAAVAELTGEGTGVDGLEDPLADPLGGPEDDLGLGDLEEPVDMNEPSMAGPEDEPLGRAPVRPELEV